MLMRRNPLEIKGLDLARFTLGFTRISLRNHIPKMLGILLTGCAYAPYAACMATLLCACHQAVGYYSVPAKVR